MGPQPEKCPNLLKSECLYLSLESPSILTTRTSHLALHFTHILTHSNHNKAPPALQQCLTLHYNPPPPFPSSDLPYLYGTPSSLVVIPSSSALNAQTFPSHNPSSPLNHYTLLS